MEAFGRALAVIIVSVSFVFSVAFCYSSPVTQLKRKAAEQYINEFLGDVMQKKELSSSKIEQLNQKLNMLGDYELKISLFSERSFENEERAEKLFVCRDIVPEKMITASDSKDEHISVGEGSIVSIHLSEKPESFLPWLQQVPFKMTLGGRIE